MKRIILIMVVALMSTATFAQSTKTSEERAEARASKMKQELSLDDKQTQKIKEIHLEASKKMEAIRAEYPKQDEMTPDQKQEARAKRKAVKEETDTAIREVLNDEQEKKWEANRAERKAHMREKRKEQPRRSK